MHDLLATPQSLSDSQYEPASGPNVASFATDHEREWLIGTLGEAFCRKIGVYRIPDDLVLSVVIPVYNEHQTIREILNRVRGFRSTSRSSWLTIVPRTARADPPRDR